MFGTRPASDGYTKTATVLSNAIIGCEYREDKTAYHKIEKQEIRSWPTKALILTTARQSRSSRS
jgi:hypothetical protein